MEKEMDKEVAQANAEPELEFNEGIAVDDKGELVVELEDNSENQAQLDATSVEDKAAETVVTKVATEEVTLLKQQLDLMKQEIETKNQILGMAKVELEKKIEQMQGQGQSTEDVEDLLETFADKDKGLKFLDGRVNKTVDQLVNQKLQVLSKIVTDLVIAKAQDEFKSKHPEAFEGGYLKQEIFDKMKPYTDRGVSWDEAYRPFKAQYVGADKKDLMAQKANKLRNVNNVGGSTGKVTSNETKIDSLLDAWKKSERDVAGMKK